LHAIFGYTDYVGDFDLFYKHFRTILAKATDADCFFDSRMHAREQQTVRRRVPRLLLERQRALCFRSRFAERENDSP
jgi:hypothetical protein